MVTFESHFIKIFYSRHTCVNRRYQNVKRAIATSKDTELVPLIYDIKLGKVAYEEAWLICLQKSRWLLVDEYSNGNFDCQWVVLSNYQSENKIKPVLQVCKI